MAFGAGLAAEAPLRSHVPLSGAELLLMPATGDEGTGVELVTVTPGNPARGRPLVQAVYVLFAPETFEPVAVIDGAALTALRTAAVSGLATRHLANPDAATLAIFGAGVQATAHLEAMRAVRPVERVRIVSRSRERRTPWRRRRARRGWKRRPPILRPSPARTWGARAPRARTRSSTADCCPTASTSTPSVSYHPATRELDDRTMARARIVVETREAALAEAGDLLIPLGTRAIQSSAVVADLAEVVRGAAVRGDPGT